MCDWLGRQARHSARRFGCRAWCRADRLPVYRPRRGIGRLEGDRLGALAFRRNLAAKYGATLVVDPAREDLPRIVRDETGQGADAVIEAVGPLLVTALQLVCFAGTVLQFGHDELAEPKVPLKEIVKKELTIRGGFIGRHSFPRVARIIESGELPLETIVTHSHRIFWRRAGFIPSSAWRERGNKGERVTTPARTHHSAAAAARYPPGAAPFRLDPPR